MESQGILKDPDRFVSGEQGLDWKADGPVKHGEVKTAADVGLDLSRHGKRSP
jgi:hypothetical protein